MFKMNRRGFMQTSVAAGSGLLLPVGAARAMSANDGTTNRINAVRSKTLDFIESMRLDDQPYGRYRYTNEVTKPTLYSSTYAAMTRHLYRDLGKLSKTQRQEWIAYLQSHQDDDGLFRDPVIFGEGWYKNDPLWCGRPHLSCHVLAALSCLGATASKPIRWLEPFLDHKKLVHWLDERDWGKRVAWTGNEVLNVGTLLQYARDFQHDKRCGKAVETIMQWMTKKCDPQTGLWGTESLDLEKPKDRSHAVQAAYHFWLLWFYDRKPIPYAEKVMGEVLLTQNPKGGFGNGVHNPANPYNSSACEDIDSIDPLARMVDLSKDHRGKVRDSLIRAEPWVLSNQTKQGSFCFMQEKAFSYGHPQLTAGAGAGGMFSTWFRTLTLAYLGKAVPDSSVGQFDWQFCNCPGIQFWFTDEKK